MEIFKPQNNDVVMGSGMSVNAAVLGGIEGARHRLAQARTTEEFFLAIQELRKYDLGEARIASHSLIKMTLNISPEAADRLNVAINKFSLSMLEGIKKLII